MSIHFFKEDITFDLRKISGKRKWLKDLSDHYSYEIMELNYIFCSDDYLLSINQEYLDHDTYTDIITFDNRETEEKVIESDIFISVDRVKENAEKLAISFDNELARVMAHGLLHLVGFKDKTENEKTKMREAENEALSRL